MFLLANVLGITMDNDQIEIKVLDCRDKILYITAHDKKHIHDIDNIKVNGYDPIYDECGRLVLKIGDNVTGLFQSAVRVKS